MNIDYKIPFYSNTKDATHCYQACFKMLLKFFWPEENYTWEKLDRITAKVKGLWTWPMAGILWLKERGVDCIIYDPFDYDKFYLYGGDYLIEYFGNDVDYLNPAEPEDIRNKISRNFGQHANASLKQRVLDQFTWEKVAERTAQFYKEMMS